MNLKEVIAVQPLNAPFSMVSTEEGIVIDFKTVQLPKADFPIDFIVFGMVTE